MLDLGPHATRYVGLTPIPNTSPAAYRATDANVDRPVVLKVAPRLSATDSIAAQLFHRGARVAARLDSPHIPRVYDRFISPSHHVVVQEDSESETLEQALEVADGRLPVEQAFAVAAEVAEALVVAHARHVVHRNLSPRAVSLTHAGTVKLGGFEVAIAPPDSANSPDPWADDPWAGNPHYTAPEQASGGAPDARSDVYSLGVLLYRMLTGGLPFTGHTPAAIQYSKENTDPPPPSKARKDLPHGTDQLVRRLLSKWPASRPATVAQVLDELRRLAAPAPAPDRDRRPDVVMEYPAPIARAYAHVWREWDWAVRWDELIKLAEVTLQYCTVSAVLSASEARGNVPPTRLDGVSKPAFGKWLEYLREAVLLPAGISSFIDRLRKSLFTKQPGGRGVDVLAGIVEIRNDRAHYKKRRPASKDDKPFREMLPGVHDILASLQWLTEYPLVQVVGMDRRKGEEFPHVIRYRLCAGVAATAGPDHEVALADGPGMNDVGLLNPADRSFLDLAPFVRYDRCPVCEEDDVFVYSGGAPDKRRVEFTGCHGHELADETPHDPFEKRGLVWS